MIQNQTQTETDTETETGTEMSRNTEKPVPTISCHLLPFQAPPTQPDLKVKFYLVGLFNLWHFENFVSPTYAL